MKSKFFAFAAVLVIGLMIGSTAGAVTGPWMDPGFDGSMAGEHLGGGAIPTINHHFFSPCALHPEICRVSTPVDPSLLADADDDGVINISDDCPGTPAGTHVEATGCPDTDEDGIKDDDDTCDTVREIITGCPDEDGDLVIDENDVCSDSSPDFAVDPDGCTVDTDGDGKTDDIDSCPDVAANTDNGCLAAAVGGGQQIGGANLGDLNGDQDGSGLTEEADGGGFCTLIENASSTNALSALILAISLIPLGIRRKIK